MNSTEVQLTPLQKGCDVDCAEIRLSGCNPETLRSWACKLAGYLQCARCCPHSG